MGELVHIADPQTALRSLRKESNTMYELLTILVGLVGEIPVPPAGHPNYPHMRAVLRERIETSIQQRNAALDVLEAAV